MRKFFRKQGCEGIQEHLSAYIDGQLASSQRASIEEHLVSCKPCQQELASLRATKNVLRSMPSVAVPRSFTIVSYRPAPRRFAFGALRLATAVAAFLLIVVGMGDYWNVFPKMPVPVSPPPAVSVPQAPEPTPAPVATTEITPAFVPDGTPQPPIGRVRDARPPSPPPETTPPASAGPATPQAAAPAPGIAASTSPGQTEAAPPESAAASPEYAWPVRQAEKVLLVVLAVLFVSSVIIRQWAYARNRRR